MATTVPFDFSCLARTCRLPPPAGTAKHRTERSKTKNRKKKRRSLGTDSTRHGTTNCKILSEITTQNIRTFLFLLLHFCCLYLYFYSVLYRVSTTHRPHVNLPLVPCPGSHHIAFSGRPPSLPSAIICQRRHYNTTTHPHSRPFANSPFSQITK